MKAKKKPEKSREELRQDYINLCLFSNVKSEDLKEDIDRCKEAVSYYQRKLVDAIHVLQTKEASLRKVRGKKEEKNDFGQEFDRLLKNPDVDRLKIDLSKGTLTLYTKLIVIHYRAKNYAIGKFRVVMHDGGGIEMHNLKPFKLYKYGPRDHHPHIEDGYPCLGNIQGTLPNVIAERQYAAAAAISIQYLKSYVREDAYNHITDWPLFKRGQLDRDDSKHKPLD